MAKITASQTKVLVNLVANGGEADWDTGAGCAGVHIRSLPALERQGLIEFIPGGRLDWSRFRVTEAGRARV